MPNFYDLGTLSSVTNTSATTIKEGYNGGHGIFRFEPTTDCAFTGIALQGSEDNSSWSSVQAISDPNLNRSFKVTLKPYMRMICTGGSTGNFSGIIEPL